MARGQRDPELERQWRERMARWQASGLSVREFCRRHGLLETSFYYWKRELRKRDAAASSAATKSSPVKKPRPTFLPLTVLPAATLSVEVRCPSGHVVVLSACDAASLASRFVALEPQSREPQAREGQPC
jgi:transposase-like protein